MQDESARKAGPAPFTNVAPRPYGLLCGTRNKLYQLDFGASLALPSIIAMFRNSEITGHCDRFPGAA